jgi:hypothetical protein
MVRANASGFYGDQNVTNSQATTHVGISTLLCMDMEKDNIRNSSITKSYTYSMDTMFTIVCIICNVNKPEIILHVWNNIHSG